MAQRGQPTGDAAGDSSPAGCVPAEAQAARDPKATAKRLHFRRFPEPQAVVEFPYALERPLHRSRTYGEITRSFLDGPVWAEVMTPELDLWAAERELRPNGKRKTMAPKFTPHEMEAAEMFRRVAGVTSYKAGRDLLAGDRHRGDRVLLGFDVPRQAPTRGNPLNFRTAGVPSEAAMSKYRTDIGDARRAELWGRFLARLREVWMAEAGREARIGHLDGFNMPIEGVCPKMDRKTGEIVNAELITVRDGGYQPSFNNGTKGGHGFNNVAFWDDLGVPLAHRVVPMHVSESATAVHVLNDFRRHLGPLRELLGVGVGSADAAFASGPVREAMRRAGFVDNIHEVSHGDKVESHKRAKEYDGRVRPIQGYPNWHVNGHRELVCACGHGTQERDAWRDPDGTARVRVKGRCTNCGSITLLSGRWRAARNPARFVPMLPGDPTSAADLPLGNPLTYRDRMAARYGKKRWVRGEGAHGVLKSHYKLNARRRYRSKAAVELETNMVFAVIVSLAIQQREHERTNASAAPPGGPPLPLAA